MIDAACFCIRQAIITEINFGTKSKQETCRKVYGVVYPIVIITL